jgi:hypothetical protein
MARKTKRPSMKLQKKSLTKRQETALKKHTKGTSAEHKKFMKRRLLMGDTIRQAHKMYKKKNG